MKQYYQVLIYKDEEKGELLERVEVRSKAQAIKFIYDYANYYSIFNRNFYYKVSKMQDIDIREQID